MENTEKEKMKSYEAYGKINYGDKRISKRLEKTLERLQENPSQTICSAAADQYEAKAIYRMVDNPSFTIEPMIKTSRTETIKKIVESGEKIDYS